MLSLYGHILEIHQARSNMRQAAPQEHAMRARRASRILPNGRGTRPEASFATDRETVREANRGHALTHISILEA